MSAAHGHLMYPAGAFGSNRSAGKKRLGAALAMTVAVLSVEIVGGLLSHSLALLADAAHVFADIAALTLAYAAMTLAERAPTGRHTFGLYRAEILAAFVNAQVLLVVALFVAYEAVERLKHPVQIRSGLMLAMGSAALLGNLASMTLLARGKDSSLNVGAAYLEVLTDALGALAVVVVAVAMPMFGWTWLDAALSGAIAIFILPRSVSLLRRSAHILLEGAPGEIDATELRRQLLNVPGIEEIHDLHFWTLTSGMHSASLHIRASSESSRGDLLREVQELLGRRAGVEHVTIQVEWGAEVTCHASSRGHP